VKNLFKDRKNILKQQELLDLKVREILEMPNELKKTIFE
jgi:hypothetical protein